MAQESPQKCAAPKRQGDGYCTQTAGWGTDHPGFGRCKLHGGCAPSGKVAAMNQQAAAELAKLDVAPVTDPLSALAELTGQAVAWKNVMAERVNMLTSLRYGTEGGEQLRAEVARWERALDRCEKFLVSMARMNIDDRLARITEQQAEMVEQALRAALAEEGLDLDAQARAARSVARHLRVA